jgi:CelD/BcsL family acetyltransferase involved in cellulose biosynthesis
MSSAIERRQAIAGPMASNAGAAAVAGGGIPIAAGTSVEITVIRAFSDLAQVRTDWNRLVERAYTGSVFQTFEVHQAWWAAFGDAASLLAILARREGELIGIAPLMMMRRTVLGRSNRVVQFIGARSFDYTDLIVDAREPGVAMHLLEALTSHEVFDLLYLRDIPGTSPSLAALRQHAHSSQSYADIRVLYDAPSRIFNDPESDRALTTKKSLKRHYNYFRRTGTLEFKNLRTADEVLPYLDTFFAQHIKRRAATEAPSLFLEDDARRFFRELVIALGPTGVLLFSVVLFNGPGTSPRSTLHIRSTRRAKC